ncbi:MAG: hypothetical protein K9K76_11770 [Halanaerobiales bacterium]|nr:hypothetical protein [Halanaerobiales bacterium]
MKKLSFVLLILLIVITISGCEQRLIFSDTDLSLKNYTVERSEITDENDNITGYSYTVIGEIKNEGKDGNYTLKLEGKTSNAANYTEMGSIGPLEAEYGESNPVNYTFEHEEKMTSYKILIYIDGDLEAKGEYSN